MKVKVHLSIGYSNASRQGIIEIDEEDVASCKTQEEINQLIFEYSQDWANNYIEIGTEIIEE